MSRKHCAGKIGGGAGVGQWWWVMKYGECKSRKFYGDQVHLYLEGVLSSKSVVLFLLFYERM